MLKELTASTEPTGGTIIAGRYRVDNLIARGGMATVFLAQQLGLERKVALKVLSPPPDGDEVGLFERRFRLEAATLASLDHPNIVVLHDFGETPEGQCFLAMEYVDGPRLTDVLRDGPLPARRAIEIAVQVASGLRYAHRRGVVHRDLKPSNLLLKYAEDGGEIVKIVDFGLVKLTEADQSITRAGLILGSPHCMSPEQVQGREVDHRADIYSLGVLMFRMVAGQYPFHGPNSAATMMAHMHDAAPSIASVAPDVDLPPGLDRLVARCLEKDPDARPQDLKEVIETLGGMLHMSPEALRNLASITQSHPSLPSLARRTTPAAESAPRVSPMALLPWLVGGAGAGLVLLVALVGAAFALRHPAPAPQPVIAAPGPVVASPEPVVSPAPGSVVSPAPGSVVSPAPGSVVSPAPDPVVVSPAVLPGTPAEPVAAPPAAPIAKTAPKARVAHPRPAPVPTPAPAEPAPPPPDGYLGLPDDLKE